MSWQWTAETRTRLHDFLSARSLMDDAPAITPIGDGHSNLIYRLDGDGKTMVLRRPPPPPLPQGGNDVLREARLLSAVRPAGVPVPEVLAVGQTGEVLDVPFYVMSMVDGIVITDVLPEAFSGSDAPRCLGEALVDAMAHLHGVDWRTAGLEDFGRPEGFNARHLKRMASIVTDEDGMLLPEFAEVHDWLTDHCPQESGASIIHNDLRIGNVMWDPVAPPRIAALLDWELATIGDPLLDFAYLLGSMPQNGECRTPVQDFAKACLVPGFPGQADLCARYEAATGRSVASIGWYLAMVHWKLAIFYHYSHKRGQDPYYRDVTQVPRFLAEARRYLQ